MNPQELVNDIKEIKVMLVDLIKRKEPATADQLAAIASRPITINPEKFAAHVADALVTALKENLPTTDAINQATAAAVAAIDVSSQQAAIRIEESGTGVVIRIERAARSKADLLASRIGFTSWQSGAVVLVGFLAVVIVAILTGQLWAADAVKAQGETEAVRAFTDWAKTQPEGKRLYSRYYNR